MGKYGSFSRDGFEFVVHDPHTPRDWFNFFWNPTFLACAGNSLSGFSLYQNEDGVVTNLFGKQDMREDPRSVYIRDRESGEIWSAGYLPCLTEHECYEVRHGLGYTILRTLKHGIRIQFRVFVPREDSGEIWTIGITNEEDVPRKLSLFVCSNVMLDGVNMPYGYIGGLSAEFLKEDNMLFFRNLTHTVVNERYRAFAYCDKRIKRWDVSKDCFLGASRSSVAPRSIVNGRLGNSVASAEHLIAAMQHDLQLAPGKSKSLNFVHGVVRDENGARRMIRKFAGEAEIECEFEATAAANRKRLGALSVESPDEDFNRLFSVWMKHQLYLMADWARFYFKGFRDTCQDSAGMSILNTDRAVSMLKRALRNQRSDGFAPRAFRVASMDIAAADKHYCDSPSWISLATDAILRETGDLSLLDVVVPYSDEGEGTIWEHNLRAAEFLWNDRNAEGLSLIHFGDWCDLIDKAGCNGRGVSIWMTFATAQVMTVVGNLASLRGDSKTARACGRRHRALVDAAKRHGWDHDHFLYAINDAGVPVGSREAKEGRFFLNPQSWALLSGAINAEEYAAICEKYEPKVDTPVGPLTSWPAYTKYDPGIGQLTGTPPGFFTNGNVYCHAASFKVAADFEAGRTEKAFDTLMRILPEEKRSEPFAQANGYVGPTAMRMERHVSDDPWRTGTVAWNMLNCFDRLLGFQREVDGVRIAPKIPLKWKKVNYSRPFRGTLFKVEIRRGSVPGLFMDGDPIDGNFIRVGKNGMRRKAVEIVCVIRP